MSPLRAFLFLPMWLVTLALNFILRRLTPRSRWTEFAYPMADEFLAAMNSPAMYGLAVALWASLLFMTAGLCYLFGAL